MDSAKAVMKEIKVSNSLKSENISDDARHCLDKKVIYNLAVFFPAELLKFISFPSSTTFSSC